MTVIFIYTYNGTVVKSKYKFLVQNRSCHLKIEIYAMVIFNNEYAKS